MKAKQQLSDRPVRSIDEIGAVYQAMVTMSGNINDILRTIVSKVSHTSDQFVESAERFSKESRNSKMHPRTVLWMNEKRSQMSIVRDAFLIESKVFESVFIQELSQLLTIRLI